MISTQITPLKEIYDSKFQELQNLLAESNKRIEGITSAKIDPKLIVALKADPELLKDIAKKMKKNSEHSDQSALLEELLAKKEDIIKERKLIASINVS